METQKLFIMIMVCLFFISLVNAQVDIGSVGIRSNGVTIPSPAVAFADTNATTACTGAQVLLGNGSCGLVGTGGGDFSFTDFQPSYDSNLTNIFNQDLNTTNNVNFGNVTLGSGGFFSGLFNWIINLADASVAYLNFNSSTLSFNESKLNETIDSRSSSVANLSLRNIFDQDLNTTNSPSFSNLTILGNLTVDTNTLIVDSGNNRVGIGTNNPQTSLEINGSSNQFRITNNETFINFDLTSEDGLRVSTTNSPTDKRDFYFLPDIGFIIAPFNYLGEKMNNQEKLEVIEQGNNKNSGIGLYDFSNLITDLPVMNFYKSENDTIDIKSITSTGSILGRLSASGVGLNPQFTVGAKIDFVQDGSASTTVPTEIQFWTSPGGTTLVQQRLVIDKDGNLGIGTTTPQQLLNVDGNVNITGGLNLSSYISCAVLETDASGNVLCSTISVGNPFDQDLNTTDSPSFVNVTTTGFFNGLFNWIINVADSSSAYLTFNGSTLSFDESKLNGTISIIANATEFNFNQSDIEFNFNQSNIEFNFNQSNIEFNFNQSIGNETVRFNALVDGNCELGFVMEGVLHNGTVRCVLDSNETIRFNELVSGDCSVGELVIGVQSNGTVLCATDGGGTNVFDQDLNTTNGVTFASLNVSGQTILGNITAFIGNILSPQANLHINGTAIFGENRSEVELSIGDVLLNSLVFGQNISIESTDGSGDLSFQDDNAGIHTLSQLAAGGVGACTQSNNVISGGSVVWSGDDLIFHVSPTVYCIAGLQYETTVTMDVTLDAANSSFDRFDIIIVNTSNTAGFVKGTPANDPLVPTADSSTQLKLSEVLIMAGATVPGNETGGPSVELIYDEQNGEDWTGVDGTGGKINFTSSGNPSNGSIHIDTETPLSKNDEFALVDPTTFDPQSITSPQLTIEIKVQTAWENKDKLMMVFFDAAGNQVGTAQTITNGAFGFVGTNTTSYQILTIELIDFQIPGGSAIKSLNFTAQPFKQNTLDFLMDYIRITGTAGSGDPPATGTNHGTLDDLQSDSGRKADNRHDLRYMPKLTTSLQQFAGRIFMNNSAFTPLTIADGFGGITLNVSNILIVDNANGRVGIGTSSPSSVLEVQKTDATTFDGTAEQLGNGATILAFNPSGTTLSFAQLVLKSHTGGTSRIVNVDGGTGTSNLVFVTSNVGVLEEEMRLDTQGRLGLGEVTPNYHMEITDSISSGYFAVTESADGDIFEIDFSGQVGIGTASPGALLDVRGSVIFNDAGGDNDFRVEGDTEDNLFITNAGTDRVGIGLANPENLFELFAAGGGQLAMMQLRQNTAGSDASIRFRQNAIGQSYGVGIDATDGNFKISDGTVVASNDFVVNGSSGFVGIGTASPGNKLAVEIAASTTEIALGISNTVNRFLKLGVNQSDFSYIAWDDNDGFKLGELTDVNTEFSGFSAAMTILTSGFVGIGTETPATNFVISDGTNNAEFTINASGLHITVT